MSALAACGGDSSRDFAAKVDAVCAQEVDGFAQLASTDDPMRHLQAAVSIREKALSDLESIEPPADLRARFDDYVAKRKEILGVTRGAQQAADQQDRETFGVARAKEPELAAEARMIADGLGLNECARVPMSDEAGAVDGG